MTSESLLYLYGIVDGHAPQPPAGLRGLDESSVRLHRIEALAAIVSGVSAEQYDEASLDARLADVQWTGERGLAHERVLTWFLDRGTVLPFAPFSLHASEDALETRLRERYAQLESALDRMRGHREWMIRIWRDEERFDAHLAAQSPSIRALDAEMEQAGEGKRFLLSRKRDTLRAEEGRRISAQVARSHFDALSGSAARSAAIPIPPAPARVSRALIMQAAFLVADNGYPAFEAQVQELAAADRDRGFDWEFTGPWPAYHFAGPESS